MGIFTKVNQLFYFKLCFSLLLYVGIEGIKGQSLNITPSNDTMLCTNQTLQLTANFNTIVSGSSPSTFIGYNYSTIPINAGPTTGTTIPLNDDIASGAINIGFPFQFYGTNYSQLFVSPNGFVSFVQPVTNDFTPEALPSCSVSTTPQSAIVACWQDFNPGTGGSVTYVTTGVAPNRRFIISWNNIPFYGPVIPNCPGLNSSFQIHLFETTNIVQIHVTNKPNCPSLGTGSWVMGLVGVNSNSTCNCGFIPPGYNNVAGGMSNQAFQFSPATGTLNGTTAQLTSLQWSINGANVIPAGNANYTAFMLNTSITRIVICTATFSIPCLGNVVIKDTVIITPRPYDATFTVTSPVCVGAEASIFTFAGSPTPGSTTNAIWAWNFGGGAAVTGTGIGPHSVTWATAGTKNVSLNLSSPVCAPGSFSTTVDVVPLPTSTFTATPQVCGAAAATVTYTGNAPSGATFTWNFNGGVAVPASGIGPFSVTWSAPGLKTISLTVSVGSCVSQVTNLNVNVLPAPSSSFTLSQNSVCVGAPVVLTYTGGSSPASTYTWNVDGGTATPATGQGPISVSWNNPGVKNITLQINVAGCISNITSIPLTIHQIPTATFTTGNEACPNQNATITYTGNATAGAIYTWNWNGGTASPASGVGPFNVNWPSAGVKNITLSVTQNGCTSSVGAQNLTVFPIPTSTFTANPAGVCVGASVDLVYTGTAASVATYTWNFNNGTATPGGTTLGPQSVNWSTAGTKTVSLVVTENGCISTSTSQQITVFTTPSADFTATAAVCPSANSTLDYIGSGTNAVILAWNFNGGVGAVGPNPSDAFTVNWVTSGNKTVTLTATENGCSSLPFNQTVLVYNTPSSSFTATSPVCENAASAVTYLGASAVNATYNWSFSSATIPSPTGQGPHNATWTAAGSYFLNLTVVENGCSSLPTQIQVVVNPIPTGNFTSTAPVCLNTETTLNYTGSAPNTAIFNWNFDGGNANILNGPGPITVEWSSIGIKNISLFVVSLGCTSPIFTVPITVLSIPQVNAGTDKEVCSGANASLGSASFPGLTYSWSPLSGLVSPTQAVTSIQIENSTEATQTYQYVLTANDGSCSATDSVFYSVTAPPLITFSVPPGQCIEGNSFDFAAQGAFTATADFNWTLGPNTVYPLSSTPSLTNVVFTTVGSQTITLQIDDSGCLSNVYSADVVIYEEPIADFSAEVIEGCAPVTVNFINNSSGPDNLLYSWNFGFGELSNSEVPKFIYEIPGVYDVSLNISTLNGCSNSSDKKNYIRVFPVPQAGFSSSKLKTTITEPEVYISSFTELIDGLQITFTIEPGNVVFNEDTVSYILPDTGLYIITQVIRNSFGCVDSTSKTIEVNTGYRIYVPNSFSPNNDGTNDFFTAYGEDIRKFKVTIFNRWGEQLYQSYDKENGWDGTVRTTDRKVPQGVYLYVIETTDDLGFTHKLEGLVHVIL